MRKGRELFVLFFCILAELGLFFQVYRPIHFVETFIIEKGMVSWTIPRIICMIPMIAIGIFAMAVIKGNANGMLHISYAVMTLYLVIMLGMMFAQRGVFIETFEIVEMNIIVYIVQKFNEKFLEFPQFYPQGTSFSSFLINYFQKMPKI